jgi:hypothetical protein
VSHVYCLECGFQNPEAANFCAKCGALLPTEEAGAETTITFRAEEEIDEHTLLLDELGIHGPALVVRAGGGRAGEHFTPAGDRTTIGRSPECDIFLDDVTVSRRHAVLVHENDRYLVEDLGSLNGTYLNRRRIEDRQELESGDELQVGKYRLTFLSR